VNHLYNDIEISRELIHDAADIENHIIHGDGEEIREAADLDIPTRFNQRAEDAAAEGDNQEVCEVIVGDVNPPDASTSASKTLVVETSRSVIKEYDPVMLTMMFPELYIYGRCGIDEQRVVQTSVEYEIAKCLRLYNRRFAQNQLFLAVAFNFLRRIKATEGLFLHVPSELRNDEGFSTMTSGNLKAALAWKDRREKASKHGNPAPPLPTEEQVGPAIRFLTRIDRANRVVMGSKEEKESHRADVWGMCYSLGEPHLMLSISPDDLGSIRVHQYIDSTVNDLPDRTTRYANLAKDPVACTFWFDRVIGVLLLNVL
jgi:hypothetical protein